MFYKVKTKLSEFLVESETYKLNGTTAVFFDGMMATNIIKDVESVEPSYNFQVGDAVNCRGLNGTILGIDTHIRVKFYEQVHLPFTLDGNLPSSSEVILKKGVAEPIFNVLDRVQLDTHKGVVIKTDAEALYPLRVLRDDGEVCSFTPDGRAWILQEPTLSLVTPQWTGLEAEYYNALLEAGASESAADYAVTLGLGATNTPRYVDYSLDLGADFIWDHSPWGDEYWRNISRKLKDSPAYRLSKLLSDKTPEIGDLVIAGDDDCLYYVGVYTQNGDASIYQYEVTTVDKSDSDWFKNIKCLNL